MNNKADIVMIRPNDQKAVYGDTYKYIACEPPYWMALAGEYVRDSGAKVVLIDAEAENLSFEEVAGRVEELHPNIVGIFVTGTNLSASTQKMQGARLTCDAIKKCRPDQTIFLWGLHPSALPEDTLKECDCDMVVKGEGFDTMIALAKKQYKMFEELSDVCFFADGQYTYTGTKGLLSTDKLPMPAWDMLDMSKYNPHNWHIMGEGNPEDAKGRYGVISTSIGCPFNCSFCAISAQFGERKVRFWDVDRVISEIDRLVRDYNTKYIKILDECFVLKKEYVEAFCDKLITRNYDLNIWAYARVDTVSEELLAKLRKAGIKWLAYGIESGDDNTLADVSKGQFTANQTLQAMKWTKEADINIIANFMFGLPEDTYETMRKSLELAKAINPEWINFAVTMAYPGSRDYFSYREKKQISSTNWIEYAQYSYECTPMGSRYLSPKEVLEYRDWAFGDFFDGNEKYFDLIRNKYGEQYVESIRKMIKKRLRRKLLENT